MSFTSAVPSARMIARTPAVCSHGSETARLCASLAIPVFCAFLIVDLTLFSANMLKFLDGGWVPLAIAAVIFTAMWTWLQGRLAVGKREREDTLPIESLLDSIGPGRVHRPQGTAVYLTAFSGNAPNSLLHNLKHNEVLHEQIVLLTVRIHDEPYVPPNTRAEVAHLGKGVHHVVLAYGFMEQPDVPRDLSMLADRGVPVDPMRTSYFVGRNSFVEAARPILPRWQDAWSLQGAVTICLILVALVYWGLLLTATLYPPIQWDATSHHLVLCREYLAAHRIFAVMGIAHPVLPALNHMLFTWGMALQDDVLAQIMEHTFLMLTALGLYSWGKRQKKPLFGLAVAAFWLGSPLVLWQARLYISSLPASIPWLRRYHGSMVFQHTHACRVAYREARSLHACDRACSP